MAVSVPKEDKVFTTVYDNFKGVDYTNDPSNVWRHRSPDGLNMLPDLDGRPYKRHGWKIEIPANRFLEEAGATGEVKPIKTMYFTIGGSDHLAIFNNLGMFIYSNGTLTFMDEYYNEGSDTPQDFPPSITVSGSPQTLEIDPYRAFFFEGQGTAGFYVYCGLQLFRYDADGKLYKVKPYIPTIIDGCDPTTGAGSIGENINLLTTDRTITYFGNGNATYKLPSAVRTGDTNVVICILDSSGEWGEPLTYGTDFTVGGTGNDEITFTTGHVPEASTVANVKVTYSPASSFEPYSHTDTKEFTCTVTRTLLSITVRDGSETGALIKIDTVRTGHVQTAGVINPSGVMQGVNNIRLYYDGAWDDENDFASSFTLSQNPYTKETSVAHTDTDDNYYSENQGSSYYKSSKVTTRAGYVYRFASHFFGMVSYTLPSTSSGMAWLEIQEYGRDYKYTGKVNYTETLYNTKAGQAFEKCSKAIVFGSGLYNQVFFGASSMQDYSTRVWYSAATKPEYIPDLNYIEVGATDIPVAGFIKCEQYLGIVKQNDNMDSSIYLAYATSFDEQTTYAIKQSIGGVGAISNGAFNILNGEPLFLSKDGVMGIELADEFRIRNRSFFVNKKIEAEPNLKNAISFVHKGMYYLAVNGHCYVLDGSQKTSWANEKTNLQYEAYYLENIPAQCFARKDGDLWFCDFSGNICRFREDSTPYRDDYTYGKEVVEYANFDIRTSNKKDIEKMKSYIGTQAHVSDSDQIREVIDVLLTHNAGDLHEHTFTLMNTPKTGTTITVYYQVIIGSSLRVPKSYFTMGTPVEEESIGLETDKYYASYDGDRTIRVWGDTPEGYGKLWIQNARYYMDDDTYYIKDVNEDAVEFEIIKGQPIAARWSTIADDDGAVHFFKNLQKKGCVVSLLPMPTTGTSVSLKADEKSPVKIGEIEFTGGTLPHEFYIKKKLKKYKRLQIICENDDPDSGFGLDQIIKSYTMGNYSKNRG